MDYKNNNWSDADIADLLIGNHENNRLGAGANSLRPALYEYYVEENGYDNRVPFFEHYKKIGAKNNVIFIGDRPSEKHQEDRYYCKDKNGNEIRQEYITVTDKNGNPIKDKNGNDSVSVISLRSKSFKNLYEPIWVSKDTIINNQKKQIQVINQKNYYAYYVYRVASIYKNYIKFYEIKNEPDYTSTGEGNLKKNEEGINKQKNWWDEDPNPKSLNNFYAPIQSYVRLLRISYEVIKSVDPNAYICVGGIGYLSFLDAILRNTDNPDQGKITKEYPYTGGAWFDCLSYHNYPMYYLNQWVGRDYPGNINGKIYSRHTDAAVDTLMNRQKEFEKLLKNYGYDNIKYPTKIFILTETNVPSKAVDNFIGGEEQQQNYLLKAAIIGQRNNLKGIYAYCPWDSKYYDDPEGNEYNYKGFYYPIPESPNLNDSIRMHSSAHGWRTIRNLLGDKKYNYYETENLNLDENSIRGIAFSNATDTVYALWARTSKDMDETAKATYKFPENRFTNEKNKMITKIKWDASKQDYVSTIINGNTVNLDGAVSFFFIGKKEMPVTHVKLDKVSHLIKIGETLQLNETIYPYYAYDKTIKWESSDNTIATVNSKGLVKGLKDGVVEIKAISSNPKKIAICEIGVGKPENVPVKEISIKSSRNSIYVDDTLHLQKVLYPIYATDKGIEWYSSNKNVATVDQNGIVTAKKEGYVWINMTSLNGVNGKTSPASIRIEIKNKIFELEKNYVEIYSGNSIKLNSKIKLTDENIKNIIWYSSNSSIATVNQNGIVTGIKKGTVWINIKTLNGEKLGICQVDIKENINKNVKIGEILELNNIIDDEIIVTNKIIWYSDDPKIAQVDQNGIVTAISAGSTYINAKSDTTQIVSFEITVTDNKLKVYILNNELNIESKDIIDKVEIYNMNGKLVHSNNYNSNIITIPSLPNNNILIIKIITDENKTITKKIKS